MLIELEGLSLSIHNSKEEEHHSTKAIEEYNESFLEIFSVLDHKGDMRKETGLEFDNNNFKFLNS